MQESHERRLRKELEAETMEDLLVSDLLSGSSSYTSLLKPSPPIHGTSHAGQDTPILITIKAVLHKQTHRPIWGRQSPGW